MDWLKDLDRRTEYRYRIIDCPDDDENYAEAKGQVIGGTPDYWEYFLGFMPKFLPGEKLDMQGIVFQYAGFGPRKIGGMTKVIFEKNGRKAVKVTAGGKHQYRSMTKDNYINGKGTDEVLTRGCKEASDKVKQEIVHDRMKQFKRGT